MNLYLVMIRRDRIRRENESIERDAKLRKLIIAVERHIPSTTLSRGHFFHHAQESLSLASVAPTNEVFSGFYRP